MRKSTRWACAVSLVVALGILGVLSFVVALSTQAPSLYERQVVGMFWLNVAVAALLSIVIVIAGVRLAVRLKRGKFGSRLLLKLIGVFALLGVVPGAIVYAVSVQFVSRSIEGWFDERVEGALVAGLALGRGMLDETSADLGAKVLRAAERLGESDATPAALEQVRDELGAQDVSLVGGGGQPLIAVNASASMIPADRPSATLLRQARMSRIATALEGLDDEPQPAGARPAGRLRAVALLPGAGIRLSGEQERFLVVVRRLPASLVANALAVQSAYGEFQQRALARDGLLRLYLGTLTLAAVLAVFFAVLLAALFGNGLAKSLLLLAEGVKQVAAGDLGVRPVSSARDELAGLTRSFAEMTEQLGQARAQVQRGVSQLESARTRLQTILDNLTAGVVVFDRHRRIDTVNPGATRILRLPMSAHVGEPLEGVPGLEAFAGQVRERFAAHESDPEPGERQQWQDAFELRQGGTQGAEATATLLVRGAMLPNDARLIVFDDITEVVSAQRQAAWSEVARRLAHEIKNPLTPIQLSAERMKLKLESRLAGAEQAMLVRSVDTIVAQVQALKTLVNEFRDYARLPAAHPAPLDLNALVMEVLGLYGDEQERRRLEARCDVALPAVIGDASQLRQVIHNLVQNALDAVSSQDDGHVIVGTERRFDEHGALVAARLRVLDNGLGFAEKVLKRAFEPYVTTKSKGTGLGLAVVKKIADEHGARIRVANRQENDAAGIGTGGAQVSISFFRLAEAGSSIASRPAVVEQTGDAH